MSAPVDCDPDSAFDPLHPPLAVQLAAFVVFHVSVDAAWYAIEVGLAERVTCAAGAGAGGGGGVLDAHLNPATMAQPGFVAEVRT